MLIIFMESSNWWPENIRCSLWRCYALTYSGHVWFANRFAGHVLLIISHHNTWLPLMRNFVQLSRHYISTQALEGAAFRALSHAICKRVSTTTFVSNLPHWANSLVVQIHMGICFEQLSVYFPKAAPGANLRNPWHWWKAELASAHTIKQLLNNCLASRDSLTDLPFSRRTQYRLTTESTENNLPQIDTNRLY